MHDAGISDTILQGLCHPATAPSCMTHVTVARLVGGANWSASVCFRDVCGAGLTAGWSLLHVDTAPFGAMMPHWCRNLNSLTLPPRLLRHACTGSRSRCAPGRPLMSAGRLGARLFLLSQGTYTAYSPECRFTKACSMHASGSFITPGHIATAQIQNCLYPARSLLRH